MWKFLQTISKNLVLTIPVTMVLGFGCGLAGDMGWLKSLIMPFTFLMVYPMMVTLKVREVFSGGDAQRAAQKLRPSTILTVTASRSKPSRQRTLMAIIGDPSRLVPRAKEVTPQVLQTSSPV